jgi:hypothetical protein
VRTFGARLGLALVLLSAACHGNQVKPDDPAHPPPGGGSPDDPPEKKKADATRALVDDLRATIFDSYRALGEDYEDAYLEGLVHDQRLIVFDVKPEDVVVGFEQRACRVRRQFPDERLEVVSKDLEVHISTDGTAAWIHDDLSYRVGRGARRATIPLRATALYLRKDNRWQKILEHVSYAIPDDEALADAAAGHAPVPAELKGDIARGAEEAARIVSSLIADRDDTRVRHVSTDEDALVLGSDPERELRGKAVAEFATVRALYGYDYVVKAEGLRVDIAPSGTVAWGAANLVVVGTRSGKPLTLRARATWVLEQRDGAFRAVQTHVSIPISLEKLSLAAFGETVTRAGPTPTWR